MNRYRTHDPARQRRKQQVLKFVRRGDGDAKLDAQDISDVVRRADPNHLEALGQVRTRSRRHVAFHAERQSSRA